MTDTPQGPTGNADESLVDEIVPPQLGTVQPIDL